MKKIFTHQFTNQGYVIVSHLDNNLQDITGNPNDYDTYMDYVNGGNLGNKKVFYYVKEGNEIENISASPYVEIVNNEAQLTAEAELAWKDHVIEMLNNSVGEHLDSNYPFWEQNKHSGKALRFINKVIAGQTPTQEENDYIYNKVMVLADWAKSCRDLRDQKEHDFLNNDVYPDFTWPERPV